MKKILMGIVVFSIMFASSLLFATKIQQAWFEDKKPNSPPQPVVPISKLRLHQIDEIRAAMLNPAFRKKLQPWTEDNGNLHVVTGHLKDGKAVYKIRLYPDMLSITYSSGSKADRVVTVRDYDLDGVVDYGHTKERGSTYIEFNAFTHQGLQQRRLYQDFYDEHCQIIADKLGL